MEGEHQRAPRYHACVEFSKEVNRFLRWFTNKKNKVYRQRYIKIDTKVYYDG